VKSCTLFLNNSDEGSKGVPEEATKGEMAGKGSGRGLLCRNNAKIVPPHHFQGGGP